MEGILRHLRLADVADILIIAILVYWVGNLIRGTRAVPMLLGLLMIGLVYSASQYFEMYTLSWILSNFASSLLLIVIILFQSDIRRALTHAGQGRLFGSDRRARNQVVEEVARAASTMATQRVGALLVLERDVGLNEYLEAGTILDARVSRELLAAIFQTQSPIHDGAVVVRRGRIAVAGCFLPLTTDPNVSRSLGSRHRAALGLTEETDAAVVVVSEEQGQISVVSDGKITRNVDPTSLRTFLTELELP